MLEGLARGWTAQGWLPLGPESAVPAPDVYTTVQTLAGIMDTEGRHKAYSVPRVVTGGGDLVQEAHWGRPAAIRVASLNQ